MVPSATRSRSSGLNCMPQSSRTSRRCLLKSMDVERLLGQYLPGMPTGITG